MSDPKAEPASGAGEPFNVVNDGVAIAYQVFGRRAEPRPHRGLRQHNVEVLVGAPAIARLPAPSPRFLPVPGRRARQARVRECRTGSVGYEAAAARNSAPTMSGRVMDAAGICNGATVFRLVPRRGSLSVLLAAGHSPCGFERLHYLHRHHGARHPVGRSVGAAVSSPLWSVTGAAARVYSSLVRHHGRDGGCDWRFPGRCWLLRSGLRPATLRRAGEADEARSM
jgi:hypothetical protein